MAPEFESLVEGAPFERLPALPGGSADVMPGKPATASNALARAQATSMADYVQALEAVYPQMSARQLAMLVAHHGAPYRTLSMELIAAAAGHESYGSANFEYGKLGHLIADELTLANPGNWTQLLADESTERNAAGHHQWVMREALAQALTELGWVDSQVEGAAARAAEAELREDPQFAEAPETTRLALVNARVGQGGYRKRMVRLWDGQCAVSGCAIDEVLIASHALPWAESTNAERLDEYNGLLLAASLDRLFDRGFIGFADDGAVVKQATLAWADVAPLGVSPGTRLRFVRPRHVAYLRAHREHFGLAA